MNKELIIGFLIILVIGSLTKILFNYNIHINIFYWSIESLNANINILIFSILIILGLIFIPKYMDKR